MPWLMACFGRVITSQEFMNHYDDEQLWFSHKGYGNPSTLARSSSNSNLHHQACSNDAFFILFEPWPSLKGLQIEIPIFVSPRCFLVNEAHIKERI